MIFYHLRQQLKRSIDDNVFIDQDTTNSINDKVGRAFHQRFLLLLNSKVNQLSLCPASSNEIANWHPR